MDVYREKSWWNFSCDLFISLFHGWPKRHRSDLQMCLWMEILSCEKLHLLIYICHIFDNLMNVIPDYQRYSGKLWLVMFPIQYAFQLLKKIKKLSFWYFFLGWFLLLWDRPRLFEDRCGLLWVVPGFSNYGNFYREKIWGKLTIRNAKSSLLS